MKAALSLLILAALAFGAAGTSAQTTLATNLNLDSVALESSTVGLAAFAAALVGIGLTGRSTPR